MRKPIPSLTGLRFLAAFSVLLAHALPMIFPWPPNHEVSTLYELISSVSGEGMALFFVLSGFVIHYNYSDQLQNDGFRGHFNFFVARFARLYPLYLCCLAYDLLYKYSYSQLPDTLWKALPFYLTLTNSWPYLPLGDHSLIFQFGVIPTVAWSVSTEMFFYCVYPIICIWLARYDLGGKFRLGLVVSVVAIAMVVLAHHYAVQINNLAVYWFGPIADLNSHYPDSFVRWLLYFSPYSRVFEFAIGCICAAIYVDLSKAPPKPHEERRGRLILWGAVAAICITHVALFHHNFYRHLSDLQWFSMSFGFALPMATVIFCCARYDSLISRFLSLPYIVLCGEISYSIYLLHLEIIYQFRWEAAPLFSARVLIADGLRFGMMAFAIIGLSLVTYTIVEAPARRLLRRLQLGPRDGMHLARSLNAGEPDPVLILNCESAATSPRKSSTENVPRNPLSI